MAAALETVDGDATQGRVDQLYREHAGALMAVAYRLLMSRADAEDVVHDVFVGLPEALRRYEERGSMLSWLKRIVVRVSLSRLRARGDVPLESAPEPRATQDDPVARLALHDALARLSPSLRAVLVLKEVEGFRHDEIAMLLGISVGASQVRLHRALARLRAMLSEDA